MLRKIGRFTIKRQVNSNKEQFVLYEKNEDVAIFPTYSSVLNYYNAHITKTYIAESDFTYITNGWNFPLNKFFTADEIKKIQPLLNSGKLYGRDLELVVYSTICVLYNKFVTRVAEYEEEYGYDCDSLKGYVVERMKLTDVAKNKYLIRAFNILFQTEFINKQDSKYYFLYYKFRVHKRFNTMRLIDVEYSRLQYVLMMLSKVGICIDKSIFDKKYLYIVKSELRLY